PRRVACHAAVAIDEQTQRHVALHLARIERCRIVKGERRGQERRCLVWVHCRRGAAPGRRVQRLAAASRRHCCGGDDGRGGETHYRVPFSRACCTRDASMV